MRAFDISGVAFALLLVPAVAWASGRVMGRRNWSIGLVLAIALILTLGIQAGIVLAQSAIEWITSATPAAKAGIDAVIAQRGQELLSGPEFPVFLLIFASFVTMIGWSATPADH
jgi:hypothetical protein